MALIALVSIPFCGQSTRSTPIQNADPPSTTQPEQPAETKSADTAPAAQSSSGLPKLKEELAPVFALIRNRQLGAARVRIMKHLKLHPDDGQAVFLFGLSYHREQRYAQAMPHYVRALELASDYHQIHHFKGWAHYYLGELDQARAEFDSFLKQQPNEPDTVFAVGLIELDEDNLDEAERHFRRSLELLAAEGGKDLKAISKAHSQLGAALERRGDLQQARDHLALATDLYPDHYESWYKLYRVLVRLGEHEQATLVHQKYLESKERVRPGTSFPEATPEDR